MKQKESEQTFNVECIYEDESTFEFQVKLEGTESENLGILMMITRGTLMASSAIIATAYNADFTPVVIYRK